MPRKQLRATAAEVQRSRRDWYAFHFENREKAKTLQPALVQTYLIATSQIKPPTMTVFGGLEESYPENRAYHLAAQYRIDVNLMNPWYLTSEGWDEFQRLWQELPEPVDLYTPPCVQIGQLYTVSTMPSESQPTGRT